MSLVGETQNDIFPLLSTLFPVLFDRLSPTLRTIKQTQPKPKIPPSLLVGTHTVVFAGLPLILTTKSEVS